MTNSGASARVIILALSLTAPACVPQQPAPDAAIAVYEQIGVLTALTATQARVSSFGDDGKSQQLTFVITSQTRQDQVKVAQLVRIQYRRKGATLEAIQLSATGAGGTDPSVNPNLGTYGVASIKDEKEKLVLGKDQSTQTMHERGGKVPTSGTEESVSGKTGNLTEPSTAGQWHAASNDPELLRQLFQLPGIYLPTQHSSPLSSGLGKVASKPTPDFTGSDLAPLTAQAASLSSSTESVKASAPQLTFCLGKKKPRTIHAAAFAFHPDFYVVSDSSDVIRPESLSLVYLGSGAEYDGAFPIAPTRHCDTIPVQPATQLTTEKLSETLYSVSLSSDLKPGIYAFLAPVKHAAVPDEAAIVYSFRIEQ